MNKIQELETKIEDLEARLIFLEELGIEAHINQHDRDEHERDVSG